MSELGTTAPSRGSASLSGGMVVAAVAALSVGSISTSTNWSATVSGVEVIVVVAIPAV